MKKFIIRMISLLAVILMLVAVWLFFSEKPSSTSQIKIAYAADTDLCGGNLSINLSNLLSSSESQPWTIERMLDAQPYPLEVVENIPDFTLQLSPPMGEPEFIAGSPPATDFQGDILPIYPQSASQATASGYNYPAPFARFQNFDSYQTYPYSTVGLLYFKQYKVDYRCSAVSIGNSAIWTAGHCIHKGDNSVEGWSNNLLFVPAYNSGSKPLGVWTGNEIITKRAWFENGDLRCDMGGSVLNNYGSQKISDVVGSLGFAYNLNNSLHWLNIGYPSSAPFDGQTQQICAGSFAYADTSMPAPSPVAMGCDMTRGSSGGPWILNFSGQAGGTNYLNGNNSYRYTMHPQELFSPYFGTSAKILYDELKSSSP